jgi:hypothetical protein
LNRKEEDLESLFFHLVEESEAAKNA